MSIYILRITLLLCMALLVVLGGCSDGGSEEGAEFELKEDLVVTVKKPDKLGEEQFLESMKVVGFVNCGWGEVDATTIMSSIDGEFISKDDIENSGLFKPVSNNSIYSHTNNCIPTPDEHVNENLNLSVVWAFECTVKDAKACKDIGFLPLLMEIHTVKNSLLWDQISNKDGRITNKLSSTLVKVEKEYDNDGDGFSNYREINIATKLYNQDADSKDGTNSPIIDGIDDQEQEIEYFFLPRDESIGLQQFDDIDIQKLDKQNHSLFSSKSPAGLLSETQEFFECKGVCPVGISWSGAHNGNYILLQVKLQDGLDEKIVETIEIQAGKTPVEVSSNNTTINDTVYKAYFPKNNGDSRIFTIAIKLDDSNELVESNLATIKIRYSQTDQDKEENSKWISGSDDVENNIVIMP